jgi:hypothetical protein
MSCSDEMPNDRLRVPNHTDKTDLWISLCLFALFLIIYLSWQTRLYNLDGLVTSWRISTSIWLENFYPHHLIYVPVSALLHLVIGNIFGFDIPLYSMQLCNCIFGAATIGLCYMFCRRMHFSRTQSALLCLFMGFSFTFWHWTTDADPYIVVNLLAIWSLYYLFTRDTYGKSGELVIPAMIFSLAILIHQMALILLLPAITLIICRTQPRIFLKKRLAVFLVSSLVPVAVGYLIVSEIIYSNSQLGGLTNFFFFHGSNPNNWIFLRDGFPAHLPAYIYHGILGHYSLFVFSAGPGQYEVFQPYAVSMWEDGILARYVLPLIVMIFSLIVLFKTAIKAVSFHSGQYWFLSVWTVPLFIFLLLWNPGYSFHRIFYLFPFLLIVLLYLDERFPSMKNLRIRSSAGVVLTGLILVIFLYNLQVAIIPQSHSSREYKLAIASKRYLSNDDLIIVTPKQEYLSRYLRCFTLCERMVAGDFPKGVPALGKISSFGKNNLSEADIDRFFGRIYVTQDILDEWMKNGKFTITFRFADDLEPRKIQLDISNWEINREEEGYGLYEIISISVL